VEFHRIFQMAHCAHPSGRDPEARQRGRDPPRCRSRAEFCARRDQPSFDLGSPVDRLASLVDDVRPVFAREAHDPAVQRRGELPGLPGPAG